MSRALLLDFDGLVLDTETTDFESWAEVYREYEVELPRDRWPRAIGSDGSDFAPFEHLCELTGLALDESDLRARRCQLGAGDAIAVEDSPNGVAAAKAAELFCVAVPGPMTRSLSFEHADLVLESLASRTLEAVLGTRVYPECESERESGSR